MTKRNNLCRFDELRYALHTALPYETVVVRDGILSKISAMDGVQRFPDYHAGQWRPHERDEIHGATPMRVYAH